MYVLLRNLGALWLIPKIHFYDLSEHMCIAYVHTTGSTYMITSI